MTTEKNEGVPNKKRRWLYDKEGDLPSGKSVSDFTAKTRSGLQKRLYNKKRKPPHTKSEATLHQLRRCSNVWLQGDYDLADLGV